MDKGDKLKAAGKEFLIDLYLEFYRDEVIETLKKVLSPFNPDDLRQFVADGTVPPLPDIAVKALSGYEDYLEKLKPEELFEWMVKARPDLAQTLTDLGDASAEYMVKLQHFLVNSIRNPEAAPKAQLVQLHCDSCGGDWPLPKNLAEQVKVCPFCGVSREEKGSEE